MEKKRITITRKEIGNICYSLRMTLLDTDPKKYPKTYKIIEELENKIFKIIKKWDKS